MCCILSAFTNWTNLDKNMWKISCNFGKQAREKCFSKAIFIIDTFLGEWC